MDNRVGTIRTVLLGHKVRRECVAKWSNDSVPMFGSSIRISWLTSKNFLILFSLNVKTSSKGPTQFLPAELLSRQIQLAGPLIL
jgi:hypothetical protein